jgi:hypothetical protein
VSDADDADPPLDAVDSQAAGAAVVLVEASAGQLSAVYDALRADKDRFADVQIHDVRGRAEAGQAGGRGGRSFAKSAGSLERSTVQQDFMQRLAEAGAERKTAEPQSTPFGRAWRLQRDDRSSLHALSASSAPPAAAASPQLRRLAPVDQAASTGQRVRVLFVLRALDSDATPAAPAASTAAPETK